MEEINQTLELERKMAREEAKRDMKMYLANDWQLKEETPEYFLLTRNESSTTGHVVVFFVTVWFTFGIGNIIYYFAKKKKKKIVK
ncbi:hypothetical protein SL053_001922 [Flavobacterium psychrophilum]|uniref:hypothetical protein n=1 Tax=Flavobacterium psychrophilum TaxID=96345 RepID=UPI0004F74E2A|nr:hypothetical protein [Flavobacterium psychrophilum]AIN75099.1 hypothetical protein FPG3_04195 [Flavobacterium psychrophilum FPG3]EKT2069835.1 hypothetical protein [Flavobacterium psychrophilum]EKT2072095.1 hypothetical protein [Flavobacterium psychrophilum]EKT3963645.1 hypothetical protein [Flavobacterium psychrophilum]EKT4491617.1 hypothetical protein [Flavobacterium psychrophilum]